MLIRPLSLLDYFVAVVMFSIGLRVSGGELLNVWHRRGLFARMLLANCILIPALGFLLVHVFPFNPEGKDWHLAVSRHSWNTDRLTVHTASKNAAGLHSCRDIRAIRGESCHDSARRPNYAGDCTTQRATTPSPVD